MEYDLAELAEWFHGHYQPYIALGIRMGELAMGLLESGRHELTIISETGFKPTFSCMTDGLQLATGCTIGNGRLRVEETPALAATFSNKVRSVRIEAKDFRFDLELIQEASPGDLFSWVEKD